VRNKLSGDRRFVKSERAPTHAGRGSLWTIAEGAHFDIPVITPAVPKYADVPTLLQLGLANVELIIEAINGCPDKAMSLSDIVQYISDKHVEYKDLSHEWMVYKCNLRFRYKTLWK
jgi:hypothetical protein